ncbi:DBH-like monooxygenase protein 1 homolog [Plakobranchus ocellatus]|uniref:DBH-like monooxygenase protein 1 homolog n=1 Tax=Plakobranchus ocellatus TaxID=259542 RepID=A0AAV3XY69_9GAST|nr:DBH-like monooxygenase protein 1 homolog [Plakobranchus ocellatus]
MRIENKTSTFQDIKRGVLSPDLFSLYSEIIMRNLENHPRIKVSGQNINNLRYAVDTVLLAENKEDLQKLLNIVEEESRKKGLELNRKFEGKRSRGRQREKIMDGLATLLGTGKVLDTLAAVKGDGGVLELVRGGQVIQEIVRDLTYNYARPPVHDLEEPAKVLPGHELRLTCFFNIKDGDKRRNRTVYFGEGSDGEMCYAFITYYPNVDHFNQCVQFDNYDICTENGLAPFGDCIFDGFLHTFQSGMADAILEHCDTKGNGNEEDNIHKLCSEQCKDAIQEVTELPCMQDRLGKQARRALLPQIAAWAEESQIIDAADNQCHME